MKTKLLVLSILFSSILTFSQNKLVAKVDERVEIVSIAFRLAGAEEYSQNYNIKYTDDINTYFKSYKNAQVVEFIKNNRDKNGLGYDAVMSMAVHLSFKNEKFSPVKEKENSLDKRWDKVDIKQFIFLLNEFYKITNFQNFFNDNAENYKNAEIAYQNSVLSDFNIKWYTKFYGNDSSEEYKIILGYGNGSGNYGIKVNPKRSKTVVNAVVGVWDFDENGNPKFDKDVFQPLLIHEFNHSYVNYILEMNDNKAKVQNSGKLIYEKVEKEMKSQAYGDWETMINESIVRAAVIRYMMDNHYQKEDIDYEIMIQKRNSFLWIDQLVDLLGNYQNNRQKYPAFQSFYPKIIDLFNQIAPNMDVIMKDYEQKLPRVISISPEIWNKQDVDFNIHEITVNFDREMTGKGVSINFGESGKEHFPLKKFDGYTNNNVSIKLLMDMKPNTEYEFVLTGNKFISKDGYPLNKTIIKFKTK